MLLLVGVDEADIEVAVVVQVGVGEIHLLKYNDDDPSLSKLLLLPLLLQVVVSSSSNNVDHTTGVVLLSDAVCAVILSLCPCAFALLVCLAGAILDLLWLLL